MVGAPGKTGVNQRCGHENENHEVGRRPHRILNIGVGPTPTSKYAPEIFTLDQRIDAHDPQKAEVGREDWSNERGQHSKIGPDNWAAQPTPNITESECPQAKVNRKDGSDGIVENEENSVTLNERPDNEERDQCDIKE